MENSKKTAIVYNPDIKGAFDFAQKVKNLLQNSFIFKTNEVQNADLKSTELIISVGGDGTLLKCADAGSKYDIKIFGFNMGRLGFLAQAMPKDLDIVIKKIKEGSYKIDERIMLSASFGNKNCIALNDIVIKGKAFSRTSTLNLYINDVFVSNYLADGLIISTPTGSTAYNLSAGGPVLSPKIEALTISPICPHTLSARPIVIHTSDIIKIEMSDTDKFYVTSDGQSVTEVEGTITIQKSEKNARLILLQENENEFYNVLREKLHWGQKPEK